MKLDGVQSLRPWKLVAFLIQYFGMPWQRVPALHIIATLQGSLTVGALLVFILRFGTTRPINTERVFLTAFAAFLLANALMVSIGRAGIVDLQTQGSRYSVTVAVSQAVLLLLLWPVLTRAYASLNANRWIGQLALMLLALGLMGEVVLSAKLVHARTKQLSDAATNICEGRATGDDLGRVYFSNDGKAHPADLSHAQEFVDYIKANKLYCFRN